MSEPIWKCGWCGMIQFGEPGDDCANRDCCNKAAIMDAEIPAHDMTIPEEPIKPWVPFKDRA